MEKRAWFFWGVLAALFLCAINGQATESLLYYADFPNPPTTEREPPIDGTRKLVEHPNHKTLYLNVRYPVQKEAGQGVTFLLSVGHELWEMIVFRVTKLELRHQGKPIRIIPTFYDALLRAREEGLDTLLLSRFPVPTHEHRRIEVLCPGCAPDLEELELEVELDVTTSTNQIMLRDVIKLYQGTYRKQEAKS